MARFNCPNADQIRDFYSQVIGWRWEGVDMDGYEDYNMICPGETVGAAGICFARGTNANMPAKWIIYIIVEDLDASVERCLELGGKIVDGPRSMGTCAFCVIQDPAGAVCALYQP